MIGRRTPGGSRRAAVALVAGSALALLAGCATTTLYADEQIRPYLESLARQRDVPLARTLTWKYHYTLGSGKHAQSWFVADGKLIKDAKAMAGVRIYTAQPITSGVSMSDVYTERARIWGPRCSTPPCASYMTYLMYAFGSGPDPRPRSSTSAGTC